MTNEIMIAGNAPKTHDTISQIHALLKNIENASIITNTDEETHRELQQYAKCERLPILQNVDHKHRINAQLTAINKGTGEINELSNAPLIIINPSGYLHRILKHRNSINRITAVIFTQEETTENEHPYLIPTNKKAHKKTSPRTRRPKR